MYGEFDFSHNGFDVQYRSGELTIVEWCDDQHMGTVKVSMNDLRDIYRTADKLNDSFDVKVGDRVVLTDELLARKSFIGFTYPDRIGVVTAVHTEWDREDMICWDFSVEFDGHTCGFHWGDVRKI